MTVFLLQTHLAKKLGNKESKLMGFKGQTSMSCYNMCESFKYYYECYAALT